MDTCSQGECGITESACSDSSAGSVYDTCTSYNQDAVDNGDSDACTGTVSTRWTYDGYSYSQGPTSSPDPGSGGGTSDEYGNCECYCDVGNTWAGDIDVYDGQGGYGVTQSFCEDNGPAQCLEEGFTCDGGAFTVSWVYDSTYTGANFGGPPPGDSGPPPGGSTSDEYGLDEYEYTGWTEDTGP